MAVLSAIFAGLTSILAKCGIRKTDSDVATALRTVVVLLFSWIMVFIVGSANTITDITPKSLIFLIMSGIATGASWICYFKALSVVNVMRMKGTLRSYLEEVNADAENMLARLETEMAKSEGVTEALKRQDQMTWFQRKNNIRSRAMEIVQREMIFV